MSVNSHVGSPRRRGVLIGLAVLLGVIAVSTVLSVDLFPVITNDTIAYLRYSDSLSELGLVDLGYRQFGYPLYLASTGAVAQVLTIEPLIFAVLVQRLLLVCGVAYAVYLWRWWSVPVVVLVLTGEVIAYTNLVLTEGLSIPLALLLACSTAHVLRLLRGTTTAISSKLTVSLLIVVAVLSLGLLTIRFPFAVFGICPLVVAVVAHGTPQRRLAWTAFGVFVVVAAGMVGLMSRENLTEYGDFSPSTRAAVALSIGRRGPLSSDWTRRHGKTPD